MDEVVVDHSNGVDPVLIRIVVILLQYERIVEHSDGPDETDPVLA